MKNGGNMDKFGKKGDKNGQWSFNEIKQMSQQEQMEMLDEMFEKNKQVVFGRKDQRHLSSAAPQQEGRRLRSAFDVFDFVNNAITSGVKNAQHTQKDFLKSLGDANKFLGPVAKDAVKVSKLGIEKAESELNNLVDEIVEALDNKKEVKSTPEPEQTTPVVETIPEPEQSTPVVEMAVPQFDVNACGKDEALNVLGSNKCTEHSECDGARTCSAYGWCSGVSGCDAVVEVEVVEEPVEVIEVIEEPVIVESIFSIQEREAMQSLADMGRLFDDEDEAKMIKLTEDLTAWINKYAPTFEDPESLLFEVTASLVTEEM